MSTAALMGILRVPLLRRSSAGNADSLLLQSRDTLRPRRTSTITPPPGRRQLTQCLTQMGIYACATAVAEAVQAAPG